MFRYISSSNSSKTSSWKKNLIALGMTALAVLGSPVSGQQISGFAIEKTIVVSPVEGSPKASGEALRAALKGRLLSAGKGQRWVIRVEAGLYDVGAAPLFLIPGVDIEGSGIEETEIVGLGQNFNSPDFSFNQGVVVARGDAGLRHLTLRCVNSPERDACIAMVSHQASPRIENVRILATDPEGGHWGLRNDESSPRLDNVEIVVANGVMNYGMVNVRGSRPEVRNSSILAADGSGDNVGIFNKLEGLPARLEKTEIIAMGGGQAVGIWTLDPGNFALTPSLDVKAGPMDVMKLINTEIAALDGGRNYGLWQGMYRLEMRSSRVISDDSAIDVGFYGDVDVTGSELRGTEYFARANHVRIAGTMLLGGADVLGATEESCTGVQTESGVLDTCP